MVWLKRNLFLILFVVGTLAMTGLAVFFLLNRIQADKAATDELKKASADLEKLVRESPYPSDENIKNAKDSAKRLTDLAKEVTPMLTVPRETASDNITFKSLLENTIAELDAQAEELGIDLPSKSSFTFTVQRAMVKFPTNSIGPLTTQLKEIREICRIMFDAKVHSLSALRRVRAYASEAVSGNDYIAGKITVETAANVSITPYEVEFKGFSSELTSVLEGFQRSPIFFVVKTVRVSSLATGILGARQPGNMLQRAEPAARGTQTAAGGAQTGGAQAGAASPLVTVLDEKPKKFFLQLEVVKTFAK